MSQRMDESSDSEAESAGLSIRPRDENRTYQVQMIQDEQPVETVSSRVLYEFGSSNCEEF